MMERGRGRHLCQRHGSIVVKVLRLARIGMAQCLFRDGTGRGDAGNLKELRARPSFGSGWVVVVAWAGESWTGGGWLCRDRVVLGFDTKDG